MNAPAIQKQIGLYRPNFVVSLPVNFKSNIVYDFVESAIQTPDSVVPINRALWNVANWNSANWGGGTEVQRSWVQAQGTGSAASIQLAVRSTGEVLWVATDYSYISGWGIL